MPIIFNLVPHIIITKLIYNTKHASSACSQNPNSEGGTRTHDPLVTLILIFSYQSGLSHHPHERMPGAIYKIIVGTHLLVSTPYLTLIPIKPWLGITHHFCLVWVSPNSPDFSIRLGRKAA